MGLLREKKAKETTAYPEQKTTGTLWTRDFILVCLTNFVIFTGFQMLMPTLPVYVKKGLEGSESIVGLVSGIFTVSALSIRPWVGLELDRRGRRDVYLLGLAVFIVSALAYHWATTVPTLLLLRILHGVGWGASTTAAATIVADLLPATRRGEGMGYFGLSANLGMAIGPFLGFFLTGKQNFSVLFTTVTFLALLAFFLANTIHVPPLRFTPEAGRPALFEATSFLPSLQMFFVTFTWGGVTSFISLHADQHGIKNIGIYFTVYALALIATRPLAGRIFDHHGADATLIPGFLFLTSGMTTLALAQNLSHFLIAAVLNGAGFGAIHPTLQALTVNRAAPARRGAANATFSSAFDVGIGTGAMFLGIVSQRVGFRGMYLFAALVGFAGLIFYFLQRKNPKEKILQP